MDMFQEGVRAWVLPENAYCNADEEKRCPLELDECPEGYENCDGNCFNYREGF